MKGARQLHNASIYKPYAHASEVDIASHARGLGLAAGIQTASRITDDGV